MSRAWIDHAFVVDRLRLRFDQPSFVSRSMPLTTDVPTSTPPASRAAVTAIVRELWRKSLVSVPAGDTTTRSTRFPFIGTLFDLVLPDCGGREPIPILHSPWRPDDGSGVVDGNDAQSPGDQQHVQVPGQSHRIGRQSLVNDKVPEDRSSTRHRRVRW